MQGIRHAVSKSYVLESKASNPGIFWKLLLLKLSGHTQILLELSLH